MVQPNASNSNYLVDADDPSPKTTVAHIADRSRVELGVISGEYRVYQIEYQLGDAQLHVKHLHNVSGKDIFSHKYGYVEQKVTTEIEFENWITQIDDVVYAHISNNSVTFGDSIQIAVLAKLNDNATLNRSSSDVATQKLICNSIRKKFRNQFLDLKRLPSGCCEQTTRPL